MKLPQPRCHDLLALSSQACDQLAQGAPAWVASALAVAPWVVVRRAQAESGRIPVGVRGAGRARRHAGWVEAAQVLRCVSPADLMALWCRPCVAGAAATRVQAGLGGPLAALFRAFGCSDAGPAGSWGFELLTGQSCTQATSDLDLVLPLQHLPSPMQGRQWLDALEQVAAPVRVDALMELPSGGLALREWAALAADGLGYLPSRQVVVRRADGPHLVPVADLAGLHGPHQKAVA